MATRDTPDWMWAQACAMLDRAERLQRQFFQPVTAPSRQSVWSPPVDVFETDNALWVIAALPGVSSEQVEISVSNGMLIVSGIRTLPEEVRGAGIRRMEIPAGRFERRVELPVGQFEVLERRISDGCLMLGLRKIRDSREPV